VRRALTAAATALMMAGASHAYTGGPVVVEVLGWDAANERLYCQQDGQDESPQERDLVYYFDFRSATPERPVVLDWSRARDRGHGKAADFLYAGRLARIVRRVRKLPIVEEAMRSTLRFRTVPDTAVVKPSPFSDQPPITLEGSAWTWRGVPEVRVVSYGSRDVRCLRRYAIPGRSGRVVVLSYIGDDHGLEEIQRAVVLLDDPAQETQVLEGRRGVQ
jgi:hypothetical protein